MTKEIKPRRMPKAIPQGKLQEKGTKKATIKKQVLALVAAMYVIPPFAWFITILVCGLVNFKEWQQLLFQGATIWVPYILAYIGLMLYLSNQWLKPIEEVLKNPDAPEPVKEKARKNIARFPIRLFIAEVIYASYGGYSSLTGYFVWTGQRPPMMDERFLSVEFSSQAVILFAAIPFIFIISHLLNSALKVIGLSERTASFTIEKQFLIGNFALSGFAILAIALFYYGRTRYFGIGELIFILVLVAICFGFNKVIARCLSAVLKGMLFKIEKIGQGDLKQEVEVNSADELGLLAVGFNQMTDNLRKSHQELEEAKINLEQKVKSRTVELEEAKVNLEIKIKIRTKELEKLAENLENQVKARTKELQQRVDELEKFHQLTVGRELKMVELKKEAKKLEEKLKNKG